MSAARLRPLVAPGLATLIGVVILVGLGVWQLGRGAWKADLLSRIEARVHAPPGEIVPEREWPNWNAAADEYRRVRREGVFLHDKETLVRGNSPRDRQGNVRLGFFVLTPLRGDNGSIVIVNRGFVPQELREPARRPGSQPGGRVTITGLVRASQERGAFVPKNNPGKGEWFSRDVEAIAAAQGLTRVAPFLIDADASPATAWPRGGLTVVNFPNNHFGYALTWFGLAAALIGVFAAWAWRRVAPEPAG